MTFRHWRKAGRHDGPDALTTDVRYCVADLAMMVR
jgi:hypothetical protein